MTSVRFLHTSDWQLGMTRHFLEGEAQSRYSAARIDAIRSIGDVADHQGCAFVVVAGDVFESNLVSSQTVRRALDAMGTIRCPVFLLPGNHDPLDAATIYHSPVFVAAQPDNVHVLGQPGVVPVSDGVEIVAAPWFTKRPLGDLVSEAIDDLAAGGALRIVVGHGAVDSLSPDAGDVAAIRLAGLEDALARGVIHYVALGDRHSRLAVGPSGRIHYSGSPEVTSFREDLPGDVLVVDLDDSGGAAATAHHVGTWRFVDLRRHVDTDEDLIALDSELSALDPKDRIVVRTALTGTLSLRSKAALDTLLERHGDALGALFPWERETDIAVVVNGDELTDLGVGGFVAAAVDELATQAAGHTDAAQLARDALSMLYRLAAGGSR